MTTLTLAVILLLGMGFPTSGSSALELSLKRKSCSVAADCQDPNKECIDGTCYCKPYYDDNSLFNDGCMKSYGAECSSEMLCNVYKNLECLKGTCSCYGKVSHVYDPYLKNCVVKPGHTCEFNSYMDVKAECVRNAECVHDPRRTVDEHFFGVCECDKAYVRKGDECVKDNGSECLDDADCDDVEGMECSEGVCSCARDRLWDEHQSECKLKAHSNCELLDEENCVANSSCVVVEESERNGVEGNSAWALECVCDIGFHRDKNGACVQDWKHADCGNGKVFDEGRGRCSTRVGGGCKEEGVNRCVSHAFCGTGKKCQCFEGYRSSETLTCVMVGDQEISKKSPLPPPPITTAYQRQDDPKTNGSSFPFGNSHLSVIFILVQLLLLLVI